MKTIFFSHWPFFQIVFQCLSHHNDCLIFDSQKCVLQGEIMSGFVWKVERDWRWPLVIIDVPDPVDPPKFVAHVL